MRVQNKPQKILNDPEEIVGANHAQFLPPRPMRQPKKRQVKDEKYKQERPGVIAREGPATVENIEKKMRFHSPRGELLGPAVFSFDLDLHHGPEVGGGKDRR